MTLKFFALPLIGLVIFALAACTQPGPAGPAGPHGPEGPVGPRGPQGAAGKDALGAAKSSSAFLRRPTVETEGKASTATCKADEEIVSALCVSRRGRSTSAEVDPEEKSARCVRSKLYMVCGKTSAFVAE